MDATTQKRVIETLLDEVDELKVENAKLEAEKSRGPLPQGVLPNDAPFATLACKVAFDAFGEA